LSLPKIQDFSPVRILEIVRAPDGPRPVAPLSIGDAHYPRSSGSVAPVSEPDLPREFDEDRLPGHRQPQTSRARL
jgi:hypothetical protein